MKENLSGIRKKFISLEQDLKSFITHINKDNPVDLGGGVFKYRLSVTSKGKGKSGGFRVISFEVLTKAFEKDITLLTIYDKSEQDSITKSEIAKILKEEGIK